MARFKVFNDKFAALFRKRIKDDDGGQFWLDFVEKSDWAVLEKVLENIADDKEQQRRISGKAYIVAPGLKELQIDYFSSWHKKREDERRQNGTYGYCSHCGGNGYVFVLMDEHKRAIDVTKQFKAPLYAGPQLAACRCRMGERFDKQAPFDWRQHNAQYGFPLEYPTNHPNHPMSGDDMIRKYMQENWTNRPIGR